VDLKDDSEYERDRNIKLEQQAGMESVQRCRQIDRQNTCRWNEGLRDSWNDPICRDPIALLRQSHQHNRTIDRLILILEAHYVKPWIAVYC
jgi:hypothetical protein